MTTPVQPATLFSFASVCDYVQRSGKRVALVFDQASEQFMTSLLPTGELPPLLRVSNVSQLPNLAGELQTIDEWLLFSLHDVAGLRRDLAAKLGVDPRELTNAQACFAAVAADYLSREQHQAVPADFDYTKSELIAYAVVCTPRSGSTYLGEMLESVGLGQPLEHLRHQETEVLARLRIGEADAVRLCKAFMWAHQRNFVFGTKIISHFLFTLLQDWSVPATVKELARNRFRTVYLVRRDKVGQAVSDFLANKSEIWHIKGQEEFQRLDAAHRNVEYRFDDILYRYNTLVNDEKRLGDLIQGTKYHLAFYEDLVANPFGVVDRVARHIGFADVGRPVSKLMKTESGRTEALRQQFILDYRERFNMEPPRYQPSPELLAGTTPLREGNLQSLGEFRQRKLLQLQTRS